MRAVTGLRGLRFTRPRRWLLVALVLICVPGTLGGLALAGTFEGPRISPQQWVDGERVPPAVTITPAQAAALGILRRTRAASDALPSQVASRMTHSPEAANGVNPSLSRRAQGFASGAAWIIPGNGVLCLEADNEQGLEQASERTESSSTSQAPFVRVPKANGTASCTTDSTAAKGWSAGTGETEESPGMIFTAGIVPDGVSSVTIRLAGGESLSAPVHENVYMTEVHGWPASVSFTGPAGPVTIGD